MDKDEIIRMAREAHFNSKTWIDIYKDDITASDVRGYLIAFAVLVTSHEKKFWKERIEFECNAAILAEREACAKLCERLISGDGICADDGVWIHDCAAAIRARGEK